MLAWALHERESEVESARARCFTGCASERVRLFSCSVRKSHRSGPERELFGKGLAPRENNGARAKPERERERKNYSFEKRATEKHSAAQSAVC
jgi:hypothetical protein